MSNVPQASKSFTATGNCSFTIITSNESNTLEYYKRIREYIQHEDYLINFRLTWSLAIHGLLFTAYGLTIKSTIEALSKSPSQHFVSTYAAFFFAFLFQAVICVVGIFISNSSSEGISAAKDAIDCIVEIAHNGILKLTRGSTAPGEMALPKVIGGGSHTAADLGKRYILAIPGIFRFAWIVLLFLSFCVPFTSVVLTALKVAQ
jgi:hypothetical protein